MDPSIEQALKRGGLADITTTGRNSGQPRRIEIVFHSLDGDHYITGSPGRKRDWLANLGTNPEFTLHLQARRASRRPSDSRSVDGLGRPRGGAAPDPVGELGQSSREGGSHHRPLGGRCPADSVCRQLASSGEAIVTWGKPPSRRYPAPRGADKVPAHFLPSRERWRRPSRRRRGLSQSETPSRYSPQAEAPLPALQAVLPPKGERQNLHARFLPSRGRWQRRSPLTEGAFLNPNPPRPPSGTPQRRGGPPPRPPGGTPPKRGRNRTPSIGHCDRTC